MVNPSSVWRKYIKKIDHGKHQCLFCLLVMSKNITRNKMHFLNSCPLIPEDIKADLTSDLDNLTVVKHIRNKQPIVINDQIDKPVKVKPIKRSVKTSSSKKLRVIGINDVLDELMAENKRLFNENKCLNEFKLQLIKIQSKYENIIELKDKQEFNALQTQLDQLSDTLRGNIDESHDIDIDVKYEQSADYWSRYTTKTVGEQYIERLDSQRQDIHKSGQRIRPKCTEEEVMECPVDGCHQRYTYNKSLNTHLHRVHQMGPIGAEESDNESLKSDDNNDETNSERVDSNNDLDDEMKYKCPSKRCHRIYRNTRSLYDHMKVVHRMDPSRAKNMIETLGSYVCRVKGCIHNGISFKNKWEYNRHLRADHNLDNVSRAAARVRTAAKSRLFPCEIDGCGYVCKYKHYLSLHAIQKHSTERPHKCLHDGCGQAFKTVSLMRSHMRVHMDGTFVCTVDGCDQKFRRPHELRIHSAKHTNIPALPCRYEGCNQSFMNTHWLRKHQCEVHNRKYSRFQLVYMYECDWPGCEYRGHHIVEHKRMHTGERPYVCDWPDCNKRFRVPRHLRDHQNIHNNLKPYVCHWPGCQYKCASSGNIWKHVKEHKVKSFGLDH